MLHFMDRLIAGRDHSGRSSRPDADSSEGPEPSASAKSGISNMKSQISDPSSKLTSEIAQLKSLAESCSRQIRAWAASLQDSDIKGQRHLTQTGREAYDAKRRAEAFWSHVDAVIQDRFPGAKDLPEWNCDAVTWKSGEETTPHRINEGIRARPAQSVGRCYHAPCLFLSFGIRAALV